MNCPQCGTETPAESLFCHQCGTRLVSAGPAGQGGGAGQDVPAAAFFQSAVAASQSGNRAPDDETETELWQGGYSSKAMVGHWLSAAVLTVLLLAGGLLLLPGFGWLIALAAVLLMWITLGLLLLYRKLNVHYRLTNQRFVHRSGILRQVTDRIEVIDMDDITFQQGLIERLLDVGTIQVTSSDRTHPEIQLRGIEGVQEVAGLIDGARRQERVRRGLHIEAV